MLLADRIHRIRGSSIEGRITGASAEGVRIKPYSSRTVLVPHAEIQSIVFTWADVVYMKSGESYRCKIVNRIPPDLIIVTETGEQRIRFAEIQMFYYHSAQNLTVPMLPPTGNDFKNDRSLAVTDIQRRIYFGLIFGTHLPPIRDWNESFFAATWIISAGGRMGVILKPTLNCNLSFEYSLYNYLHYNEFKTEFHTLFISAGAEWVRQINRNPITYASIGADAGILVGSGHLYLFSYRKVDFLETTPGFLPRAGIRMHIGGRITLGMEAAYLFAKPLVLQTVDDLTLDLSFQGPSVLFNMLFHF